MNILHSLTLTAALMMLSGCSSLGALTEIVGDLFGGPKRTALRSLSVSADIAANASSATMLDIVFVYDAAAAAQVPKTGPLWFQQKQALQRALTGSIDVVALEVPAGSPVFNVEFPDRASRAIAVYALANYIAEEGQPIANLTPWKHASIRLHPRSIDFSGS